MTVEQALARARELRPGCKISDETCAAAGSAKKMRCCASSCLKRAGPDPEYAAAGADLAWSGEALPDDTVLLVPV